MVSDLSSAVFRRLVIVVTAVFLSSCASVPKIVMDAGLKRSLTSVEPEEPAQYIVDGAADVPGGFMLYAFGAIGGAVLGAAIASKMEDQARALTASLVPHQPKVGSELGAALKAEFEKRGVTVTMLPTLSRDPSTKKYVYSTVTVAAQAIIEPVVNIAGYRLNSGSLKPFLGVRFRVLDPTGAQEKYQDLFLYGDKLNDRFVTVAPDPSDAFPDLTKLFANGEIAAKALRKGAGALAQSAVGAIKD
jgi:hypothetical protein